MINLSFSMCGVEASSPCAMPVVGGLLVFLFTQFQKRLEREIEELDSSNPTCVIPLIRIQHKLSGVYIGETSGRNGSLPTGTA